MEKAINIDTEKWAKECVDNIKNGKAVQMVLNEDGPEGHKALNPAGMGFMPSIRKINENK
ncbi:MAG: hypothetical protein WCG91_03305 [Candidatus Shapirobacteria bacterium]